MAAVQVEQKNFEMPPRDGFTIAQFLTVADINRSVDFYATVFGGRILSRGDSRGAPGYVQIANIFYIGLGDRFDADKLQPYPPGPWSCSRATRHISTGRCRASTSHRCPGSGRSASSMSMSPTIHAPQATRVLATTRVQRHDSPDRDHRRFSRP
jgi:hypothetical protein